MQNQDQARDHGGGLDGAAARYGGPRAAWLDLSTGINPVSYPLPDLAPDDWTALPDRAALDRLTSAARRFWAVPDTLDILPASGASALIAALPRLAPPGRVSIPGPTYNEHAAGFASAGWQITPELDTRADATVLVHPNNPDGRLWSGTDLGTGRLTIIDESFADTGPEQSLLPHVRRPGTVVLKSFGKFWGLAGLRLGFAISDPRTLARLRDMIGPWAVSGPALRIGAAALSDRAWAEATRRRLTADAHRLDSLVLGTGAVLVGGTPLFRLYAVETARALQDRLARHRIWSRVFPYSDHWLRLGLPGTDGDWDRVTEALA